MEKATKRIMMVEHGGVRKIARAFNLSEPFVSMVLRGKKGGTTAKKILHVAREHYGGVEMQAVTNSKQ